MQGSSLGGGGGVLESFEYLIWSFHQKKYTNNIFDIVMGKSCISNTLWSSLKPILRTPSLEMKQRYDELPENLCPLRKFSGSRDVIRTLCLLSVCSPCEITFPLDWRVWPPAWKPSLDNIFFLWCYLHEKLCYNPEKWLGWFLEMLGRVIDYN